MPTIRSAALITGATVALLAAASTVRPLASAAEAGAAPAAVGALGVGAPDAGATTPAGYRPLVDDTGRLSMLVPVTWTEVVTAPADVDGTQVPAILATTPNSDFPNSVSSPGALYVAFPFTTDLAGLAANLAPEGCQPPATSPVQNAALTGVADRHAGCGPTASDVHIAATNPADSTYTAVLIMHSGTPIDPNLAPTVLASLNTTAGTATPTTVPVVTGAPVSTAPAPVTTAPVPSPPVTTAPIPTVPPVTTTPITAPPVTTVTVPAPPVTTAPPVTVAPPITTAPTPTTAASTSSDGIVVTDAGDPTAPVTLLVPFVAGQQGTSENFVELSGTITASGTESWTTQWQSSEHYVGIDEVVSVDADGSTQVVYTTSLIEFSETYSNPEIAGGDYDPTLLQGIPLLIGYGPDRLSTSVVVPPGTSVSSQQQALIDNLVYTMPGFGFPTTPVGVGATWTAPLVTSVNGVEVTGVSTYELLAVTGDRYELSSMSTLDLATADPASYPTDISAVSGTITLTNSITGSLTQPLQYRQTGTVRTLTSVTYTDGTTIAIDTTGQDSFEETPA